MDVIDLIKGAEGCRLEAYQDTLGVWTVGYGCTGPGIGPETVWDQDTADAELDRRAETAVHQASDVVGDDVWRSLNEARQACLADMAYQLGGGGLAKFRMMLAETRRGRFAEAAAEGLNSRWAAQTPRRARRNMTMLETGEWPARAEP